MNTAIELEPNTSSKFAVQAYVESIRSWVTVSMRSSYLGEMQTYANQFMSEFGVKTRIKKLNPETLTSEKSALMAKHVRRNRSIFEPDGYKQHLRDIKRDIHTTEQHQALEDVE